MKGMAPISIRSGVEKKVILIGYRSIVDTTVRRSRSTQDTPACLAAIPTARPQGPAPITSRSVASIIPCSLFNVHCSRCLHFNDLIPPGAHAHVPYRHAGQGFQPVEVGPGGLREISQPAGRPGSLLPPW